MDEVVTAPFCPHTRRDKHRSLEKNPFLVRRKNERRRAIRMRVQRNVKLHVVEEDEEETTDTPDISLPVDEWYTIERDEHDKRKDFRGLVWRQLSLLWRWWKG